MSADEIDPAHLVDLIGGVNRRLEQVLAARLKPHGLTIEQYRVLRALVAHNGLPMGDLAARVLVDSPTLTKIIDKMVTSADVYRGPDPLDRRRVLVFLSAKGVKTFAALEEIGEGLQTALIDRLGAERASRLEHLLSLLLQDPVAVEAVGGPGARALRLPPDVA